MCNCIKDTENKLKELVKDDTKFKKMDSFRVVYPNVGLVCGKDNKWESKPYLEFIAEGKYETKSGNIRTKKESLNVTFSYCPLCGEKL